MRRHSTIDYLSCKRALRCFWMSGCMSGWMDGWKKRHSGARQGVRIKQAPGTQVFPFRHNGHVRSTDRRALSPTSLCFPLIFVLQAMGLYLSLSILWVCYLLRTDPKSGSAVKDRWDTDCAVWSTMLGWSHDLSLARYERGERSLKFGWRFARLGEIRLDRDYW